MTTKQSRRAAAAGLVLVLSVATFLVGRKQAKPFAPAAPEFRRLGPEDAKVVLVEFSDFQCPACRAAEKPLQDLLKLYEGKVRFIFKHFPLPGHQWARPAAVSAECAGRQGRFWDYHHLLYERQQAWSEGDPEKLFPQYAKELKLDVAAWEACVKGGEAAAAVAKDYEEAEASLVGSTPTFFVNGRRLVGGRNLALLGPLQIDKELKRR